MKKISLLLIVAGLLVGGFGVFVYQHHTDQYRYASSKLDEITNGQTTGDPVKIERDGKFFLSRVQEEGDYLRLGLLILGGGGLLIAGGVVVLAMSGRKRT